MISGFQTQHSEETRWIASRVITDEASDIVECQKCDIAIIVLYCFPRNLILLYARNDSKTCLYESSNGGLVMVRDRQVNIDVAEFIEDGVCG